jgi:hypothetical protein
MSRSDCIVVKGEKGEAAWGVMGDDVAVDEAEAGVSYR